MGRDGDMDITRDVEWRDGQERAVGGKDSERRGGQRKGERDGPWERRKGSSERGQRPAVREKRGVQSGN